MPIANVATWWKAAVDVETPSELNHLMKADSTVPWPEHMKAVFGFVGRLIEGKQLRPEHLVTLQPNDRTIVPDHQVTVSHIPKARTGGKQGRYVVVIEGPRIKGRWDLLPGEMDRLCREATST